MHWDELSHGLHRLARRLITPQLMRRAVRPPQERRDYESIEVGISGKGTFMDQPT
jgi:hypothetical protein